MKLAIFHFSTAIAICAAAILPCSAAEKSTKSQRSLFELVVVGSGGPRSFGRACTSYVVLINGTPRILVDAGPGAFLELGKLGLDLARVDLVLLTHLHIDHSSDIPGIFLDRALKYCSQLHASR